MYRHPARLSPSVILYSLATVGLSAAWHIPAANAGGFALIEHGASGLGNAYAGAAAVSADTSTVWFNPAGMSEIDGREIAVGLHLLKTDTEWTDNGTRQGSLLGGTEVSGPETASPGTLSTLPNFYYVAPINDQWSYGLSIGVPFGSSTEYDSNWKGRYTTVKSGLNVIDINPALSYRISDKVRVGFGISFQQLTAELGSSVDSGAVCFSFAGNPAINISEADCIIDALTPGNVDNDTPGEITGDSTAFGFNLGALFLPTENVKIGLAYRHSVDHELEGDVQFDVNPQLQSLFDINSSFPAQDPVNQAQEVGRFTTSRLFNDVPAVAEVKLPAMLSLSGAWQATDKVQLLSDLTWTGWSSFQELRVVFDNQAQPDRVSTQEWEDVIRFSAGLNYQRTAKTTLRAGFAYDQEPIPSAQRRTARIPGNDRTWLSFGLGYQVNPKFSFDVGYTRLFLDDTPIDNPNEESEGTGVIVRGVFEPSVDILSAQINWDFN